jgi:hypothetical protein
MPLVGQSPLPPAPTAEHRAFLILPTNPERFRGLLRCLICFSPITLVAACRFVLLSLNFAHFREDSSRATEALPRRFRRHADTPARRYDRLLWLRLAALGSPVQNSVFAVSCLDEILISQLAFQVSVIDWSHH